jgi:phosphopantetheinyl transferase
MTAPSFARPGGDEILVVRIETTPDASLALAPRRARHRDAARREVLRVLAAVTGTPVDRLAFVREMSGKPRLTIAGPDVVAFNVSHTDGVSLLVVSNAGLDVGVDVEAAIDLPDAVALAKRTLTDAERAALSDGDRAVAARTLLQRWTEKEAVLKAAGLGLSCDPRSFSLVARSGAFGTEGVAELRRFRVWPLDLGPGFTGAVAADRRTLRVTLHASHVA